MRFRRGWLLLVASAVVAGACDTGETAEPDTASFTSSTWSRVSDDETVLGGAGRQQMLSVTAGGPGLVAVGLEFSGDGAHAAVWTSSDGITWSRVPHAEALGRATGQVMVSGRGRR